MKPIICAAQSTNLAPSFRARGQEPAPRNDFENALLGDQGDAFSKGMMKYSTDAGVGRRDHQPFLEGQAGRGGAGVANAASTLGSINGRSAPATTSSRASTPDWTRRAPGSLCSRGIRGAAGGWMPRSAI